MRNANVTKSGLQKGPLENYQEQMKNLIIETRNQNNIYTNKTAFDSQCLKAVSESASLIAGSNLFQISPVILFSIGSGCADIFIPSLRMGICEDKHASQLFA